jgi:hypothetical protein
VRDLPEFLEAVADLLKGGKQRGCGVQQLALELAHGLEDVGRAVNDHEGGEEHLDIDFVRRQLLGRRSVAKGAEQMDPLQAGVGDCNHLLLTEETHEGLEPETYNRSARSITHGSCSNVIKVHLYVCMLRR